MLPEFSRNSPNFSKIAPRCQKSASTQPIFWYFDNNFIFWYFDDILILWPSAKPNWKYKYLYLKVCSQAYEWISRIYLFQAPRSLSLLRFSPHRRKIWQDSDIPREFNPAINATNSTSETGIQLQKMSLDTPIRTPSFKETLEGSFSAVSTLLIARVGAFFQDFRDLQDLHSFAPLRPSETWCLILEWIIRNLRTFRRHFAKCCWILNFHKISIRTNVFHTDFREISSEFHENFTRISAKFWNYWPEFLKFMNFDAMRVGGVRISF